ncbi:hypothetical protein [Streptomyces sp. NPDC055109]
MGKAIGEDLLLKTQRKKGNIVLPLKYLKYVNPNPNPNPNANNLAAQEALMRNKSRSPRKSLLALLTLGVASVAVISTVTPVYASSVTSPTNHTYCNYPETWSDKYNEYAGHVQICVDDFYNKTVTAFITSDRNSNINIEDISLLMVSDDSSAPGVFRVEGSYHSALRTVPAHGMLTLRTSIAHFENKSVYGHIDFRCGITPNVHSTSLDGWWTRVSYPRTTP